MAEEREEIIEEVVGGELGAPQAVMVELFKRLPRHASRLAQRVAQLRRIIDGCEPLKKVLVSDRPIEAGVWEPRVGVAVDSTFPPEGGIDLVVGTLIGVVAGYLLYHDAIGVGLEKKAVQALPAVIESMDEAKRVAAEASKLLERRLVLKTILPRLPSDSIVLVDGEIVPYLLYFTRPVRSLRRRLDETTSSVLRVAREKRIVIAGVVKRSYTFLFSVYGAQCTGGKRLPLNDKSLASLVLQPGRYLVLGRYSELLPLYARLVSSRVPPEKMARLVEERLGERSEYGDVIVAFYKPSRVPEAWQAVKLEVYAPWLEPEEAVRRVVSHLDLLTNRATGLPYPIDFIDQIVRLEARALDIVRQRLFRLLAEKLVENGLPEDKALLLTFYTNPEKRYLYRP